MKMLKFAVAVFVFGMFVLTSCSHSLGGSSSSENGNGTGTTTDIFGNNNLYDTRYKAVLTNLTVKYGENMLEDLSCASAGYVSVSSGSSYYAIPEMYCNMSNIYVRFIHEDLTKNPPEATFSVQAEQGYCIHDDRAVAIEDARTCFSNINPETGYWQYTTNEYSD